MDRLLTRKEVARTFGVNERTVADWVKQGKIPCVKVGRRFWVPESATMPKDKEEKSEVI